MEIELLLDAHAITAESPTWVPAENAIYWIDVRAPALHRFALAHRTDRLWRLPADVGAFALLKGHGEALVALRDGLWLLNLATGALRLAAPAPFDPTRHRFNEGACDSTGRFWVGTMFDPLPGVDPPEEPGRLYSFTLGGGLKHEPDAAELHNGMAWSGDETRFYLSHSKQREIFTFRFDADGGTLSDKRPFAKIAKDLGVPDGAATDADGHYWCAVHGASRLRRYRLDGTLDREVMLPVSQPTMCAFAGADLDVMIVTSASDKLTDEQRQKEPNAGGLFCFKPGVRGVTRHSTVR